MSIIYFFKKINMDYFNIINSYNNKFTKDIINKYFNVISNDKKLNNLINKAYKIKEIQSFLSLQEAMCYIYMLYLQNLLNLFQKANKQQSICILKKLNVKITDNIEDEFLILSSRLPELIRTFENTIETPYKDNIMKNKDIAAIMKYIQDNINIYTKQCLK